MHFAQAYKSFFACDMHDHILRNTAPIHWKKDWNRSVSNPPTNVAASAQTYGPCEWRANRKLFGLILILAAYPSWVGDSKVHLSSGLSSLDVTTEAAYGFLINHKPASLSTKRLQNLSLLKTDTPQAPTLIF